MQQVNVPGVGTLQFPDGMSQVDMASAIQKNYPQIHQSPGAVAPEDDDLLSREEAAPTLTPGEAAAVPASMSEGAKRFWGGIKQLGADLYDVGHFAWTGTKPTMTFPGQTPSDTVGARVTGQENARQQAAQAAADARGPEYGGSFKAGAQITETALNALPAMIPGEAETLGGNMLLQGGRGAAAGAASFSPTNDKAGQAAAGAAGGAALGVVGGAYSAARNYVARAIRSTAARSETSYQAAKDTMQWGTDESSTANADPTLGMRTGNPAFRSLEQQSFNARLQERYQSISDWFAGRFRTVFDLPNTPMPATDAAFTRAQAQAEGSIRGMQRAASQAYDDGMAEAARLSNQVSYGPQPETGPVTINQGGPVQVAGPQMQTMKVGALVRADNLSAQLGVLRAQLDDPIGSSGLGDELRGWIKTIQARLQTGNNYLSVKDTAGVLRDLRHFTDADQTGNATTRALANKLRDSFETDLDLLSTDSDGAHPAVQQILNTRAQYRAAQQNIDALRQTAAYRFLGVGPQERDVDPATLLDRYRALTPERQQQVSVYLHVNSPELLSQMRGRVLQEAAQSMDRTSPAAMSQNSPGALVDALFGDGSQLKTSGLWNPQELRNFNAFREAYRVISNQAQRDAGALGTTLQPAELGQQIVGRNPIFMSRHLIRVLTAGQGDRLLSDPNALYHWTRIRNTSGPTQRAAIAAYANYLSGQRNGQSQTAAGSPTG